MTWEKVEYYLKEFTEAVANDDVESSRLLLVKAVSGFHPQCDVADLVFGQNQKVADEYL